MRSLTGSQQFELVPGMTKNKSQYFGGKITTPGQLGSSHNLTLNAQRLILRKGPSFAGMSQIATPSAGDESMMKATVQSSHRVLTKGTSQRQIGPNIHILQKGA